MTKTGAFRKSSPASGVMKDVIDLMSAQALSEGRNGDPFTLLGPHGMESERFVRAFLPSAKSVEAYERETGKTLGTLTQTETWGLFSGPVIGDEPYVLRIHWPDGVQETEDPYSFGLLLGDLDIYLIGSGRHADLGRCLGGQVMTIDGVQGVRFAVWAPNARRVSVVGDFNVWDGRRHPMRLRQPSGIWELFIPRLQPGALYKYELIGPDGALLPLKADPIALATEVPPATSSRVADATPFKWTDAAWMAGRGSRHAPDAPLSMYELHAGSWRKPESGHVDWAYLTQHLVPYAAGLGFTHIELMPIMEHPFGGSWGYQPLGLFAPTARFGSPKDFMAFVDACHAAGLGVVLDWVPAHFPSDAHGLAQFDGTSLYEHADPREGFHQDWNTLIYNFGRTEVRGFLVSSALHWLKEFHIDGLRVDAVASMLYRDYSRKSGEWVPNIHGGRENLEAVGFVRALNEAVADHAPGAMVIAEESTSWPGVTNAIENGGLGFSYKWNMGWMHDTLRYMEHDPIHRFYHHDDMTFGLVYAFSERFLLPLSHDEVVYGKGSMIGKMPGDRWQKFANLRAYYGFMWGHPGKRLLFMGSEFAQNGEWNHDTQLDWDALNDPLHSGMLNLVGDLNRLYRNAPALYRSDTEHAGFRWIVGDDRTNSVFAFLRTAQGDAQPVLCVSNMTPVPRNEYRVGVPHGGVWQEVLNTDAGLYGGANIGNGGVCTTEAIPSHSESQSLLLTLPPLATVFLQYTG